VLYGPPGFRLIPVVFQIREREYTCQNKFIPKKNS
jgi:hypothetical protein